MSVPVLTAVSDPRWEADLVSSLTRSDHGVRVVRRCVDLADLLAAAAAGLARAVLLSADLRRLDRDAVTRLTVAGVAVVGLVPPGDDAAEQRLRQLGVAHVMPADSPAERVSAGVLAAIAALRDSAGRDYGDPLAGLPQPADPDEPGPVPPPPGNGRLVAVWGPTGAPGRSTVAVNVAAELAAMGCPALLVDADVYGGTIAALLGLLDESAGLAAACRLANNGTLDRRALAGLAVEVRPGLRVLTGISRPDRWPELRPSATEAVLAVARGLAAVTVVDCGFSLEQDEELAFDTAAPRRNGATLAVLDAADAVVAVTSADPVSLQRYARARSELAEVVPGCAPVTVVNRLRGGAVGPGDPRQQVEAALQRYAGAGDVRFVPDDRAALDACLAAGRTLSEAAPASPAREALRELAASLVGKPAPRRRRRLLAARRGSH